MDDLFQYAFLRNALLSACSVALCASLIGYFLIGRGMTFVAHALPNIGFAGAMGSVLLGLPPLWGLLAFSSGAALSFSFLGKESRKKDQGIGVVMMLALGLGSLFLGLYRGSSQKAYGILFGSILGVGASEAWATLATSAVIAAALLVMYRPLVFSTIDAENAAAKGVPVRVLGAVFLLLAAVTVALAVPVTGTLLVFTLLVGPPATARLLTRKAGTALLLGVVLAEFDVTVGLFLAAWQGSVPVGFFVTAFSFITYLVVRVVQGRFPWKRSGSEVFRNAFFEGTLAAVLCSAVGYFMVLRALTFAGEALTDIGFAGATGGVLAGLGPLWGMVGLGFLAVLTLGGLNERIRGRDVEIGMTLSFALGLGVLFLSLFGRGSGSHASGGVGLLFGSLMSVTTPILWTSFGVAVLVLLVLAFVFRPLLFSSIDPATARARGVPIRALGLAFLFLLALATAVCVQAMGVLLSAALLVAPAGAAHNFRRSPLVTLFLSLVFALGVTWLGLAFAFFGPLAKAPVGFYISFFAAGLYGISVLISRWSPRVPQEPEHHHHETFEPDSGASL